MKCFNGRLSCGMFVEVHTPQQLTGQELDAYLERGWFRMGQTIFTTNFAHVKDQILSTIWLRIVLNDYCTDSSSIKLFKRNSIFKTTFAPAVLNEEKEILYARYRQSVLFPVSESLQQLLFGKESSDSIYTTVEITVYGGHRLIACGFFDLGETSAQGIVSFYDPDYKKYSLGRYLIYRKMEYVKQLGLHYFYPGYFVPGNPCFDYKLNIGRTALEFLALETGQWNRIDTFSPSGIPVHVMHNKLTELQNLLQHEGLKSHVVKYEFFDAGLIPGMRNTGLLDFPLFLHVGNNTGKPINVLVVFNIQDGQFHVLVCVPVWKPDRTNPDETFYSSFFLKPVQEVYQTPEARSMAGLLLRISSQELTNA